MPRLPWTKFQDFYLRLGFLKVLMAVLNPQRRSARNEAIIPRLEMPLFEAARAHPVLWRWVEPRMYWYDAGSMESEKPSVAEALLVAGNCPSFLFAVTRATAYKVLDWGHNLELAGRANQITERGILLRHLLPQASSNRFLAGDAMAWNPFQLETAERLFFLYHLAELDEVTLELIDELGRLPSGTVIEAGDAARLTCHALVRVLERIKGEVQPHDIPAYRRARDLATTIAQELDLPDLVGVIGGKGRRTPKVVRPSARRSAFAAGGRERQTTKNADHQAIPRFEQLVDLGFLEKDGCDKSYSELRRRWRYVPTDASRRWVAVRMKIQGTGREFLWNGFASAAGAAFHLDLHGESDDPDVVGHYLWRAYETVHRPVGHTPLESLALFGMLLAVTDGRPVEMASFHRLMMAIKRTGVLADRVYFASGNALDKMFVALDNRFLESLGAVSIRDLEC